MPGPRNVSPPSGGPSGQPSPSPAGERSAAPFLDPLSSEELGILSALQKVGSGCWTRGCEREVTPVCLSVCLPLRSECNSNRDSVLSYTSVRSNSSYLGSDEMGSGECSGSCSRAGGPPARLGLVYFCFITLSSVLFYTMLFGHSFSTFY